MRNEMPLYLSVLYSLMQKILYGDYQKGQKLPPRERLAQEFQVSEITVRKSIQALADLGYLETMRGRPPVVSVDVNSPGFHESMIRSCMEKKATVLDVIQTNRMVYPPFLYQGLVRMDRTELVSLKRQIQHASLAANLKQLIKKEASIDERIFRRVGSPLLMEYYASSWSYLSIILGSLGNNKRQNLSLRWQECLQSACDTLLAGGPLDQKDFILAVQSLHDRAASYIDHAIPTRGEPKVNSIFYQGTPVYLLICIELMRQIYSGHYLPGNFLPSDDSLAQTYHVAVNTVR